MAATFKDRSEPGLELIYEWTVAASEEGAAKRVMAFGDLSYAMAGTFGGTVTLQGNWHGSGDTPDSTTWQTLHESDNTTAIALTANGIGVVLEKPVWIRAIAGVGVTSVVVVVNGPWWKRS